MLLLQGRISPTPLPKNNILAVLGSKEIVEKCTAAIVFRTVDWKQFLRGSKLGVNWSKMHYGNVKSVNGREVP